MKRLTSGLMRVLADPLRLFTGKKEVSLPGVENNCGGRIFLRNSDPLPVDCYRADTGD